MIGNVPSLTPTNRVNSAGCFRRYFHISSCAKFGNFCTYFGKTSSQSRLQFQRDPHAAQELLSVGETALPKNMKLANLAAMMTVTRALLNLHEMITRN